MTNPELPPEGFKRITHVVYAKAGAQQWPVYICTAPYRTIFFEQMDNHGKQRNFGSQEPGASPDVVCVRPAESCTGCPALTGIKELPPGTPVDLSGLDGQT